MTTPVYTLHDAVGWAARFRVRAACGDAATANAILRDIDELLDRLGLNRAPFYREHLPHWVVPAPTPVRPAERRPPAP